MQKKFLILLTLLISCSKTNQPPITSEVKKGEPIPTTKPSLLLGWTDQVLTFNENLNRPEDIISFVQSTPKMRIELERFNQTLKDFGQKLAHSPLAQKDRWLKEYGPQDFLNEFHAKENSEYFNIDHLDNPKIAATNPDILFFLERINVPIESKIIVMGDFHGSIHSLIRNLWRLRQAGYISDDLVFKDKKYYMIFTGDFIDRGRFSLEVLYTLMLLKLANFNNVFLIRGNHERLDISSDFGFKDELIAKYGDTDGGLLYVNIMQTLRFLPVAIFAKSGNSNIHFSHGGFSYNSNTKNFLHEPKSLINSSENIEFELIPSKIHYGYAWSDFHQDDGDSNQFTRGKPPVSGANTAGLDTLNQYLVENDLKAIFRGHQDQEFGLKMLFDKNADEKNLLKASSSSKIYKTGPFHWKDVVQNITSNILKIADYVPVYTFTTAAEGQKVPYDCYGIITTREKWQDFTLEVHEIPLPQREVKSYAFVSIDEAKTKKDDGISVTWSNEKIGTCLIK